MNLKEIERIMKLSDEIDSFRHCYDGNELWGERDGPVPVEKLISFLIEHPEFSKIAESIRKLDRL